MSRQAGFTRSPLELKKQRRTQHQNAVQRLNTQLMERLKIINDLDREIENDEKEDQK